MTGKAPNTTFGYAPGPHTAIVVAPVCVLIGLPMTHEIVPRLYDALVKDPTAEAALDVLASGGITHMPSFGIMTPSSGETRLVVRGVVSAQLDGDRIDSKGLFTDTTVAHGASVALVTPDAESDDAWPIRDGIVAVGRIDSAWPRLILEPPPEQPAKGRRVAKPVVAATAPAEPAPPAEPAEPDEDAGKTTVLQEIEMPPETVTPSLGTTVDPSPTMSLDSDSGKSFIESFDWMDPADAVPPPPPPPPPPAPPAPSPAVAVIDAPPPPPPDEREDMTGHTIRRPSEGKSGEQVAAVRCPYGHLNPPFAERCRVCQEPISPQDPVTVTRPSLGHLRLSNGLVLTLDRGVVLGRNPHAVAGAPGPQPNLVRLNDPNKDISSQHLEVRLEGWFVTVRDLKSTNGTQVVLPGQPPITLRADEPMTIGPGAKVVLADVFDFLFEADQ